MIKLYIKIYIEILIIKLVIFRYLDLDLFRKINLIINKINNYKYIKII